MQSRPRTPLHIKFSSLIRARPSPRHCLRFSQIVLRIAIVRLQSYEFPELGDRLAHLPFL